MGCGWHQRRAMAQTGTGYGGSEPERHHAPWSGWGGCRGRAEAMPPSGNRAFDEYRADTLRRLEDEQKEFATFLDRLRFARDKAEFDAFVEERRRPPAPSEPAADAPPA